MCNAYRLLVSPTALFEGFDEIGLPVLRPDPAQRPNLEPLTMTRPTNVLPILRPIAPERPDEGLELVTARWGLIPWFHKGALKDWKFLTTNARSEAAATTRTYRDAFKRRRCLVPADGFYEWTGEKGAKTRWLFTRPEEPLWCFAGLWDRWEGADGPLESFTLMTTAPGLDVAPYHNRQPVVMGRGQWAAWLDLDRDPGPILQAGPAGTLTVAKAP